MVKALFFTRIVFAAICTLSLAPGAAAATLYSFSGSASFVDPASFSAPRLSVDFEGTIMFDPAVQGSVGNLTSFSGLTFGATAFGTSNTAVQSVLIGNFVRLDVGGSANGASGTSTSDDDFNISFFAFGLPDLPPFADTFELPVSSGFFTLASTGSVGSLSGGQGSVTFTRIEAAVVPLPAGIWLGLTGLLALGALRRRGRGA